MTHWSQLIKTFLPARLVVFFEGLVRSIRLLTLPSPATPQLLSRITTMECDIILPLKAAGIGMLLYSFYFRPWFGRELGLLEITVEMTTYFLWLYIAANVVFACCLLALRRLPAELVQWVVFVSCLMDVLFIAALTLVTGGYQSFLYWLFPGLIVRAAVSIPRATSQLAVHFTIIACYVLAGVISISVAKSVKEQLEADAARRKAEQRRVKEVQASTRVRSRSTNQLQESRSSGRQSAPVSPSQVRSQLTSVATGPENSRPVPLSYQPGGSPSPFPGPVELDQSLKEDLGLLGNIENPVGPLVVQVALLVLVAACAYSVQVLLDRQRRTEQEARELAIREGQLRSVGRLAAEFAHQIKNPLAIINNAAFSLQRSLKNTKPEALEQIQMIQEEVERADRIITEVMGYAQLNEGRVEKLEVIEELDRAIARVFPPAARFPIEVKRHYVRPVPLLVMQRRHAAEIFINILQNAREALAGRKGLIQVGVCCRDSSIVEVTIRDNGPGIPRDQHERIFEAYYTMKEKGTGLGLATVKQNVELYGGTIRVESELGKGACFILLFPAETLMKLVKKT